VSQLYSGLCPIGGMQRWGEGATGEEQVGSKLLRGPSLNGFLIATAKKARAFSAAFDALLPERPIKESLNMCDRPRIREYKTNQINICLLPHRSQALHENPTSLPTALSSMNSVGSALPRFRGLGRKENRQRMSPTGGNLPGADATGPAAKSLCYQFAVAVRMAAAISSDLAADRADARPGRPG